MIYLLRKLPQFSGCILIQRNRTDYHFEDKNICYGVGQGLARREADHRPSVKCSNLIMTSETADHKNGCKDDLDADNFSSGSIANPANTDENKNAYMFTELSGSKLCWPCKCQSQNSFSLSNLL